MKDIFFLVENTEIYNYVCNYELENVCPKLEIDSEHLSKWFDDNIMNIDDEKCHFIFDVIMYS